MTNANETSYEAIRKIRTPLLIILSIITFGIYWYIWLWRLITDVNKLYPEKYIHRLKWFNTLILIDLASLYMNIHKIQTQFILNSMDLLWIFVPYIIL